MYLTISKRFEISSSHRLYLDKWSEKENYDFFGRESGGIHGHGHNFEIIFVFHGPVNDQNGMMINVTIIKEKIKKIIDARYDHKFLNLDTPPFDKLLPTPENLASQLLKEAGCFLKMNPSTLSFATSSNPPL